jgi:ribosomal protein S18 acetylase RimI-like enzyme
MHSHQITIRQVAVAEAEQLLQLSRQTFFDAFAAMNTAHDMELYAAQAFTIQKIQSELSEPGSAFYFAMLNNNVAGYLKLNTGAAQTEFKTDHSLEVERIYVLAGHQGKSIGSLLLNFATQTAINKGYHYIWLGVFEKNHGAIRFYQRNGFQKFSHHAFLLGTDLQTDLLMKRPLP